MTTDEIIKALRWCQDINKSCDGCPCDGKAHCHDRLMSLAADELERLSISQKNADSANNFLLAELRDCKNELGYWISIFLS